MKDIICLGYVLTICSSTLSASGSSIARVVADIGIMVHKLSSTGSAFGPECRENYYYRERMGYAEKEGYVID